MTGIPAVPLTPAAAAGELHPALLVMPHPRHGEDAGGDGNDAETQKHDHRSQQPPQLRLGNHIAVADGGHGDDGPVDATRHRLELGIRPSTFDHKNAVTEHHLQQKHKEQEDTDGAGTAPQRLAEHPGLINELEQFEHPQDAAELEHPQQQLTAHLRHEEEQHR